MKRILVLFLVLMVASSVYAFEAGTKTVGGWIGYDSYKIDKDADAVSTITFAPWIGYFFMDNILAEVGIGYSSTNSDAMDDPITSFNLELGGAYFFNNIYAGAGFAMASINAGDEEWSGNYLGFGVGYLYGIAENIYLDVGFGYEMGLGEYGGDGEGIDNEESGFEFGAGIDIFFK
ncbi:MAG: hypothetical protein HQ534_05410 [Armatimonadetes bacterium]|nr:hypothetical protein [Armatimonadota bacterium]